MNGRPMRSCRIWRRWVIRTKFHCTSQKQTGNSLFGASWWRAARSTLPTTTPKMNRQQKPRAEHRPVAADRRGLPYNQPAGNFMRPSQEAVQKLLTCRQERCMRGQVTCRVMQRENRSAAAQATHAPRQSFAAATVWPARPPYPLSAAPGR